jgi:hypothetical protein
VTTTLIDRMAPQGRLAPPTAFASGAWLRAAFQRLTRHPAAAARPGLCDRAREAASVRALADTYLKTDPGFAADLYAAADRHEQIYAD